MHYYRYDTHVHTSEVSGCALVSARDMVSLYNRLGYQGLIITDHYRTCFDDRPDLAWHGIMDCFLEGYRRASEAGRELGMDILLGVEMRFDGAPDDYLVFGFEEEFLYENPYLNRLGLKGFHELIHGTGILFYQAHPFRVGMTPGNPAYLDGVEGFNGNPRHNSHNDKAYAYARDNGLLVLAGSDAHQPQDVGNGGIGVYERISSSIELAEYIRDGRPMDLIHRW